MNRNNPKGLLRKCMLSNKQTGFGREPAQKIIKVMGMLGVGDVLSHLVS